MFSNGVSFAIRILLLKSTVKRRQQRSGGQEEPLQAETNSASSRLSAGRQTDVLLKQPGGSSDLIIHVSVHKPLALGNEQ